MNKTIRRAGCLLVVITGALGAGCSSSGSSTEARAENSVLGLTARPAARLILSEALVQRLQARRNAADPTWTALARRCDEYATGTMYPPGGQAYPSHPSVGQGYQGEEYVPAIRALGLCYRTVRGVDAAAETRYGQAGARLLEAMSTPVGSGGQSPATDSGYGIRNYGVGMALGYDWLYPALDAALKTRVVTALNTWMDWYDQSGFIKDDPIGNYFAGYFFAKTATALATDGENPKAGVYWNDVVTRMWGKLVKPQFQERMTGGGWPEGWGYGKKAVLNFAEALWSVKTAAGLDWWNEIPLLRDQASYLTHFAWPSLKHMDDQGTIRSGVNLRPSSELASGLATMLELNGEPYAAQLRDFAADVVAAAGDDGVAWSKFLYGASGAQVLAHENQSRSHFASGPEHVSMRSDWDTAAVWGALSGGPYINAAYSGEQLFDAGGLSVVVGDQPLLINPTGWLPQHAGTAGENFVYDDGFGKKQRRLYNTFFVDDASNPYNPGQNSFGPSESKAHVERFEDTELFVRARATGLEDQYGWRNGSHPVTQFTRDLVYLRPGSFVLFDRTTVARAGADQWLSFHTPTAPSRPATADVTQRRFDVAAGSIRTLLPSNASISTVALPAGATRIEVHAPVRALAQQWLSVVTATPETPEQTRLSPADGNVISGNAVGVQLGGPRNQVVLFPADQAATGSLSSVEYRVQQSADADHVLVDVAASSSGYTVTATASGANLSIEVAPGGSFQATPNSTLSFSVSTSGKVAPSAAVPPPPTTDPIPPPPTTGPVPPLPEPVPPPPAAQSHSVSFTQGVADYRGVRDATISNLYYTSTNTRGTTFPIIDRLFTYALPSYQTKALLRFDLASVPADASVTKASLELTVESWVGPQALTGSFLATDWEIASPAFGWTETGSAGRWASPGIGAADITGPSFRISGIGASGAQLKTVELDALAVQSWVRNPATNHGLVLSNTERDKVLRVYASEASNSATRPTLRLTYVK